MSQYELAYRMQISVPEVMDISKETAETLQQYGAEPGKSRFARLIIVYLPGEWWNKVFVLCNCSSGAGICMEWMQRRD